MRRCEIRPEQPSARRPCDAGSFCAPLPHRALYASFDRVPSPKGAATHIERFASALFAVFDGGCLHVLGDDDLAPHERDGMVEIFRYRARQEGFLQRAMGFGRSLGCVLDQLDGSLAICHFRDPWSGVPILDRPHDYATVYELNGLPSIELPSVYPGPRRLPRLAAVATAVTPHQATSRTAIARTLTLAFVCDRGRVRAREGPCSRRRGCWSPGSGA
jgi:hypothetical protein